MAVMAPRFFGCLTKREVEILKVLLRGKSNKEIRAELFISDSCVKQHLLNIGNKLEIRGPGSRIRMVTWAIAKGIEK